MALFPMTFGNVYYLGGFRIANRKAQSQGFTLLELMIVVVILGLLSALVWPSFMRYTTRARQANALKYVGSLSRAQQYYFLEHARFASSLAELGFNHLDAAPDYGYAVKLADNGTTVVVAAPANDELKGYAGLVYTTTDNGGNAVISTLVCEGSRTAIAAPTLVAVGSQLKIADCAQL
ncbi:type IV pilin-like G/H family protein [Nodosilinea sp. P-1105]|uniref:type IV pilin protein n=1 Tax=Nodosilinea sp. P-1105 TaxID=2546229 RepID=UPI00146E43FA|nr:type IV pilin-like G/H family protein [Nodosilinea sp. P-1105]NMF84973.1 prepilin-type N-terminal cleavage/methylation domain-containing protein [Nodosilinea sp. P-1105]